MCSERFADCDGKECFSSWLLSNDVRLRTVIDSSETDFLFLLYKESCPYLVLALLKYSYLKALHLNI